MVTLVGERARYVVQERRRFGVLRATDLLDDGERAHVERVSCDGVALRSQGSREGVEARCDGRIIRGEHLLADGERALEYRPRSRRLALLVQQIAEVHEARGRLLVIRTVQLLHGRDALLGVVALRASQLHANRPSIEFLSADMRVRGSPQGEDEEPFPGRRLDAEIILSRQAGCSKTGPIAVTSLRR